MYSMQYSASFTLTLYGEDLAKLLAEYWTKKMSWYYDRWVLADRGLHVFTDAEVAEFPDAQAFSACLADASGKVRSRMQALQDLRPGVPKKL